MSLRSVQEENEKYQPYPHDKPHGKHLLLLHSTDQREGESCSLEATCSFIKR
jgi:hypothetical protein